eukprot:COSAG06_NODE_5907_length_3217_cov_4.295382_6_plen_104_part_00
MFPLMLLAFLSSSTYDFDTDDIAGRSDSVATYFLAAFAMLYVVGESLPKTDFLTKIDQSIVLTTATVAFTGGASRMIILLHNHRDEKIAHWWNTAAFIASSLL